MKGKFLKLVYMQQGFNCTMEKLPFDLKKLIFSFLTPQELLLKVSAICRSLRSVSQDPILWRKISLFASKESSQVP